MNLRTSTTHPVALEQSISIREIGFDFDGVIADTAEAFVRLACEDHNYCSFTKEDITNFELENCIDIPTNLVEKIFTDILLDSIKTKLQPMDGAVAALSELARDDRVTIITARPVHEPVFEWLRVYFDRKTVANLRVVATGDHNDKVRHIHSHGIKYFIDDRADTCKQLAEADITPIVFSQPWNDRRHNFQSVTNWDEIRNLINTDLEIQ